MEVTIEKDENVADCYYVYYGDKFVGYTMKVMPEGQMLHFNGVFNLDEQIDILQKLRMLNYHESLRSPA